MYIQFHEASNIILEPQEANIYLFFFERAVNKAIIQHHRIQYDKIDHENATPLQSRDTQTKQLADIHYYLINWTETHRYYQSLNRLQPKLQLPQEQIQLFLDHRDARNFIEHRNEKIKPSNDLGNFFNDTFTYNDKSIKLDKSDLNQLLNAYLQIIKVAVENFQCYEKTSTFEIAAKYNLLPVLF